MPVTAPTLTDGPVTLRHPQESDVQGGWEQCQDPLSQQWTTVPIPYSHADARDFILGFVPGAWESDKEWGFVVEAEGRYAGHIALRNEGSRRAEIAYGSHPWVRGTGHMEHALRMLLDWGFREKDLATVIWLANVGNWASRRLAWKLGFSFEGTLRQWLPHRGELRDAWAGTLLADDPREPQGRWIDDAVLEGPGVRLRPFREEDAARVVEGCRDERTQAVAGRPARRRTPRTRRSPSSAAGPASGPTGTRAELGGGRPRRPTCCSGAVGSTTWPTTWPSGQLGYWTHPDARGRGVMTAAVASRARARFRGARPATGQGVRRHRQRRVTPRAGGQRPDRAGRRAAGHRRGRRQGRRRPLRRPA